MIICRPMTAEDSIEVYALMNGNLDGTFSLEVIEYFITMWPGGQFVAEDVFGNMVGALCGAITQGGNASIALFAVDAKHRGQGIGTKLLETFRTKCYMSGYSQIQLELRVSNESAYRFYTKNGFMVTERLPSLYAPGEDGYRMVAQLGRVNHVSS